MSDKAFTKEEIDKIRRRRVPCLGTFIHPFRIVNNSETAEWDTSIEEVNSASWDYVALHEMVGGVDVGLEAPYHLVVCRDGGIAVPPIKELRDETAAVAFFNQTLAALLLGGVYCEAINLDGVGFGSIIDWKYVRIRGQSHAASNRFHDLIRSQRASAMEAIALKQPRTIEFEAVRLAIETGKDILDEIPQLGGEFLLRGVTGVARRDWGTALANLWIAIEQVTSYLWEEKILNPAKAEAVFSSRMDQLSDNRTWTVSARHELLFQKNELPKETYKLLTTARKARNALSHRGSHPNSQIGHSALNAFKQLLSIALPENKIPFNDMDVDNHFMSDPFAPRKPEKLNPQYFMEIFKLPGELELEQAEANLRRQISKSNGKKT